MSAQHGVAARWQLLAAGVAPGLIRGRLDSGRWQTVFRGVYATFSEPLPRPAWLWAAVLRAGTGAALSHLTAAEMIGLVDGLSPVIHVTVPEGRRAGPMPGVRIHRADRACTSAHPSRLPPRTGVEETVLDLCHTAGRSTDAASYVLAACGRRLTTPARLRAAVATRGRMRWRETVQDACAATAAGCRPSSQARHLAPAECPHGAPEERSGYRGLAELPS
jgi:hypothetical protein